MVSKKYEKKLRTKASANSGSKKLSFDDKIASIVEQNKFVETVASYIVGDKESELAFTEEFYIMMYSITKQEQNKFKATLLVILKKYFAGYAKIGNTLVGAMPGASFQVVAKRNTSSHPVFGVINAASMKQAEKDFHKLIMLSRVFVNANFTPPKATENRTGHLIPYGFGYYLVGTIGRALKGLEIQLDADLILRNASSNVFSSLIALGINTGTYQSIMSYREDKNAKIAAVANGLVDACKRFYELRKNKYGELTAYAKRGAVKPDVKRKMLERLIDKGGIEVVEKIKENNPFVEKIKKVNIIETNAKYEDKCREIAAEINKIDFGYGDRIEAFRKKGDGETLDDYIDFSRGTSISGAEDNIRKLENAKETSTGRKLLGVIAKEEQSRKRIEKLKEGQTITVSFQTYVSSASGRTVLKGETAKKVPYYLDNSFARDEIIRAREAFHKATGGLVLFMNKIVTDMRHRKKTKDEKRKGKGYN